MQSAPLGGRELSMFSFCIASKLKLVLCYHKNVMENCCTVNQMYLPMLCNLHHLQGKHVYTFTLKCIYIMYNLSRNKQKRPDSMLSKTI